MTLTCRAAAALVFAAFWQGPSTVAWTCMNVPIGESAAELGRADAGSIDALRTAIGKVIADDVATGSDIAARRAVVVALGESFASVLSERDVELLVQDESIAATRAQFGRVASKALKELLDEMLAIYEAQVRAQEDTDLDSFIAQLGIPDIAQRVRELVKAGDDAAVEQAIAQRKPEKAASWTRQLRAVNDFACEQVEVEQRFVDGDKATLSALLIAVAIGDSSSLERQVARVGGLRDLRTAVASGLAIAGTRECWKILLQQWRASAERFHGPDRFRGMEGLAAIGLALQRGHQDAHAMFTVIREEIDAFPVPAADEQIYSESSTYRAICGGYAHALNVRFRRSPEEVKPLARSLAGKLAKSSDRSNDEWEVMRRALKARSLMFLTQPDLCREATPSIVAAIPSAGGALQTVSELIVLYPPYVTKENGVERMHPDLVSAIVSAAALPESCNFAMQMMAAYGSRANVPALVDIAMANVRVAPLAIVALVNARGADARPVLDEMVAERPFQANLPRVLADRIEPARKNLDSLTTRLRENPDSAVSGDAKKSLAQVAEMRRVLGQEYDFEFTQAIAARDLEVVTGLASQNSEDIQRAAKMVGGGDRSDDFPAWRWNDRQFDAAVFDAFSSAASRLEGQARSQVEVALCDAMLRVRSLASREFLQRLLDESAPESELGAHLRARVRQLSYPPTTLSEE
ncbi:MAG: hypothetical protein SGJ09_00690 [Phycisphaerae bacterium]|nr:hypothetical protein [Phycisphaerae bacterium]